MIFSSKAEYGVRLMVELGRRAGAERALEAEPVSLASLAEAETLPLAYLEHLVANLRDAHLVSSVRGAISSMLRIRPFSPMKAMESGT